MTVKRKGLLLWVLAAIAVLTVALPALTAEHTIKVGTVISEQHVDYITLVDVFKKIVEDESKGRMKVEIYPNAQLGGDREMIEAVQLGTLETCLPTPSVIAGFDKRFSVFESPYLFDTYEEAFAALNGKLGALMDSYLAPLGLMNLGYANIGFRQVLNNKRAIFTPDDMKGLKIRVMEVPVMVDYMKELGANPTPISYGELYTALQQGTVDGNDQPYCMVYDGKIFEVQKYLSETNHFFTSELFIAGKPFMDKLPADLREIVVKAGKKYCEVQWGRIVEQNKKDKERIQAAGVKINELTPEQVQAFKKKADAVYDKYKDIYGPDVMAIVKELRK